MRFSREIWKTSNRTHDTTFSSMCWGMGVATVSAHWLLLQGTGRLSAGLPETSLSCHTLFTETEDTLTPGTQETEPELQDHTMWEPPGECLKTVRRKKCLFVCLQSDCFSAWSNVDLNTQNCGTSALGGLNKPSHLDPLLHTPPSPKIAPNKTICIRALPRTLINAEINIKLPFKRKGAIFIWMPLLSCPLKAPWKWISHPSRPRKDFTSFLYLVVFGSLGLSMFET